MIESSSSAPLDQLRTTSLAKGDAATSLWGRSLSPGPTTDEILSQVRAAALADATGPLQLVPIARNPIRCDYFSRATFRVLSGEKTLCHLTVGKKLADLYQRSNELARACPSITCRPLFWQESENWDFFGVEFFEGENLETLLLDGRLSIPEATAHAEKIAAALAQTGRPSSIEAARRELNELFDALCALPLFDGLDQTFLDHFVFPSILTGLLAEPAMKQWTNGDLIARNILVDTRGNARLIDYEFAEETHLFAADAWRWRFFSTVPPEIRDLPSLSGPLLTKPWLESLALLRQMLHQYRVNGAHIVVQDGLGAADRLVALASQIHAGFRTSTFFRALTASPLSGKPPSSVAQLYWSQDGNYREAQSQSQEYAVNSDASLSFFIREWKGPLQLRFDPAAKPGLLKITAFRLRETETKRVLLSLNESTGWKGIRLDGGLLRLAETPALNLLSLNDDPNFSFPEINLGDATGDLACEVWLRFSSELTALPSLLPKGL